MSDSPATQSATDSRTPLEQVSVIVPTIGRPDSLRRMLESLCRQTAKVHEVIVADGSQTNQTQSLVRNPHWQDQGLFVDWIRVQPPNAVRQRQAAIQKSQGNLLLLLDDDVVLEPDCVEQMISAMRGASDIVGVFADFTNQAWPMPTRAWRFYMRYILGMKDGEWQGKVVGPLLRFGYNPPPQGVAPIEWLGTCNTMVRREAYQRVGGFSDFFLHRCTMNEDVDLGLKISAIGRIVFCSAARMAHIHAPGGRVSAAIAAEDDLYNRYYILRRTLKRSFPTAVGLIFLFVGIESVSNVLGCLRRCRINGLAARVWGRLRALARIVFRSFPAAKTSCANSADLSHIEVG